VPSHKILVIDDSKAIRMHIKNMLPPDNFVVEEAQDGLEAYNFIQRESPKLIVLNLLMPKMTGWELYQKIQKQQQLKTIPLVFISGRKEELTDNISEPFEYFAFLEKPFCKEQLFNAMKEATIKANKYSQLLARTTSILPTANISNLEGLPEVNTNTILTQKIFSLEREVEFLKNELNHKITGFVIDLSLEVEQLKRKLLMEDRVMSRQEESNSKL
jgi:CheY-like chemotaxis protein